MTALWDIYIIAMKREEMDLTGIDISRESKGDETYYILTRVLIILKGKSSNYGRN